MYAGSGAPSDITAPDARRRPHSTPWPLNSQSFSSSAARSFRGLHRQSPRGVEGLLIRRSRFARISHCSSQFSAGWCDFRTGAHSQLLRATGRIGSRCGDALLTQRHAFTPRKACGEPGPGGAGEGEHPIVAPDTQSAGWVRAGGHRPRLASAGAQPPHEVSETPELDGYYDHADLSPWEKRPVR